MSLFLKTSYEQSETLLNCLGETLQLVECLDSLNTDLMQPYSDAKTFHSISLPIQEWKDKREEKLYVSRQNGGEIY